MMADARKDMRYIGFDVNDGFLQVTGKIRSLNESSARHSNCFYTKSTTIKGETRHCDTATCTRQSDIRYDNADKLSVRNESLKRG